MGNFTSRDLRGVFPLRTVNPVLGLCVLLKAELWSEKLLGDTICLLHFCVRWLPRPFPHPELPGEYSSSKPDSHKPVRIHRSGHSRGSAREHSLHSDSNNHLDETIRNES